MASLVAVLGEALIPGGIGILLAVVPGIFAGKGAPAAKTPKRPTKPPRKKRTEGDE